MSTTIRVILLLLILSPCGYGQATETKNERELSTPALSSRVAHFELTDATLVEGLSKLSLEPILGVHIGIEEVLRDRFSDAPDRSIRFSLSLQDTTVYEIIETPPI